MPPLTIPHIGTLLNAAQVSWTYYYQDWDAVITTPLGTKTHQPVSYHENPFTFFNDFADVNSSYSQTHIKDDPNFYADLASGNLASVTWVKPDQTDGFGVTVRPTLTFCHQRTNAHSLVRIAISDRCQVTHSACCPALFSRCSQDNNPYLGQIKLKSYMDAIYASSYWKAGTMMVIVSFSDSDGLYDHVPPYTGDSYGPGGRVPTIVISPDTAGGQINSQPVRDRQLAAHAGHALQRQRLVAVHERGSSHVHQRLHQHLHRQDHVHPGCSWSIGRLVLVGSSRAGGLVQLQQQQRHERRRQCQQCERSLAVDGHTRAACRFGDCTSVLVGSG